MVNTERIEYHIKQARRYNLAVADPNVTEWDMARKTREHATYHLDMADWYMSEPERPASLNNVLNAEEHTRRTKNDDEG